MTDRDVKLRLLETLWERDADYYRRASEHVRSAAAGGEYAWLRRVLPADGRVLEVGCGDGVHFDVLGRPGIRWVGCDLSRLAVGLAADRVPPGGPPALLVADAEALPFAPGSFDAVLAVSLLEHLPAPERALDEMIAVLAPGGRLCILSPQYGAPLGASPCRRGGGGARFARRFLRAHLPSRKGRSLGWDAVHPAILSGASYSGDEDAVNEPELRGLVRFLTARGLLILDASSGMSWQTWRRGRRTAAQSVVRGVFEVLGRARIPPYRWWGPLVCVCAARRTAA